MTVTINASTSSGLITTADNSGILGIQTAGTTALTIDASQNVGIGTASPAVPLDVVANSSALNLRLRGRSADSIGQMEFWNNAASARYGYIGAESTYMSLSTVGALPFLFGTNATERARITDGGVFLVGTSTVFNGTSIEQVSGNPVANQVFSARHTGTNPNGMYLVYSGATPNGGANYFILASDGTTRFYVASNGGIGNYSGNNVNLSDRREKTNFAPATSYLAKICAIPVQTFNYIDQNMEEDGGLTLGVVAQDVQAVAPELVTESNWANKDEEPKMRLSIYQTDLQYALMKCIQEQQAIIESLTQRITALEGAQP